MPMTKKEAAYVASLQQELARARALRWADYQPERVDVAKVSEELRISNDDVRAAWTFKGSISVSLHVKHGCFGRVSHSTHHTDRTTTQTQGGPWFPTKRDALMAMRLEMTETFAAELAKVDQEIAACETESNNG